MGVSSATGRKKQVTFRTLLFFFIPLGFSASLVTISHVIINSTLARAPHPAMVIAGYSVAMSMFGILERCAVILRQTSSTLVRDKISFKVMSHVSFFVILIIFTLSLAFGYLPVGKWFFSTVLGVKDNLLLSTMNAYRVLLFVTVFSGVRCLFQGLIISKLQTNWMTIGMVIRLIFMSTLCWVVLANGWMTHSYIGALIFLFGMMVETSVSVTVGRYLVKQLPKKRKGHSVEKRAQILQFYRPFLFASLLAVSVMPVINAGLGWSKKPEIAIASFAIGWSVTQLFMSFTTYVHQIVIHFHEKDAKSTVRFTFVLSLIPSLLLACIAFTPVGIWGLHHIIGISGKLLDESLIALRCFILFTLCFPWLDFVNGLLMLKRQTRVMTISQIGHVLATVLTLILLVIFFPNGGGAIGAASHSIGIVIEFLIVVFFLKYGVEGLDKVGNLFNLKRMPVGKWAIKNVRRHQQ